MAMPIDISEEAGVRYLHFGSSWIQGAMRIARPFALELDYTRDMMVALLLRRGAAWPRKVLIIGLGAASIPKFLHRHRPRAQLRVIEIEPRVIAAARQFFRLPADDPPRLTIDAGDGDDYIARTTDAFDLVIVDGFDANGHAGALDREPFYARVRSVMTPRGLMVVNLLGRSRGYKASVERIANMFEQRAVILRSESGNVIVFASAGERVDVPFHELRSAAAKLRRDTGLNLLPSIARLTASCKGQGDRLML